MLTFYILIWPALALGVLVVIVTAFVNELRKAKREGKSKERATSRPSKSKTKRPTSRPARTRS